MRKEIIISYIITCPEQEASAKAEAMALEQSVELPREAIKDPCVARASIPDIIELSPLSVFPNGLAQYRLRLAFSAALAGRDIPQFLNILFGNVSLQRGIFIESMDLPDEILSLFPGPAHGIKGIRDACGVHEGALLCSVLKPAGTSTNKLAETAGEFANAGVPFIKDDHGIADQTSSPFAERVRRVQAAIKRSGSKTIYLPNITGPHETLEEKIAIAFNEGIKGFLVSPFLTGLDTFRYLRERYPVLWMAHPAFSGTFFCDRQHGFKPGLLLGTILRLLGADMVIYPDAGGRFTFTRDECSEIADGLRKGFETRFKPAMPVPAGGISKSKAPRVLEFYGTDVMLLIGGSIFTHKDGLKTSTSRLMDKLNKPSRHIPEKGIGQGGVYVQTNPGIWEGIKSSPYKPEWTGFKGITRTELYVPKGSEASFDVRYFEIEPGGYSSFEKHRHVHLVIGARGTGEIRILDKWQHLPTNAIAFVPQGCPHQLRNQGPDVFGFYCIVDHIRDDPVELYTQ